VWLHQLLALPQKQKLNIPFHLPVNPTSAILQLKSFTPAYLEPLIAYNAPAQQSPTNQHVPIIKVKVSVLRTRIGETCAWMLEFPFCA